MAKKRKIKYKYLNILVVIILVLILVILLTPLTLRLLLRIKGYTRESAELIYKEDLTKRMLDNEYNKTLDMIMTGGKYDKEYLDRYLSIEYTENEGFIEHLNDLLKNKYTDDQIKKIYAYNNKIVLEYTVKNEVSDIEKYLEVDILKPDRLDRYRKQTMEDYKERVMFVNLDRDKKDYEDPNIVKDYSTTMLVNKHNKLDEKFEPEVVLLTKCSSGEEYLSKEAKEAYDKMCDASLKDGMKLGVTSSYRSFADQTSVYNYYLKHNGQAYVNKYVATPGYSEHQTGLALDVKSLRGDIFKNTKEYTWMLNNSYKYGFVLRYPEEKQDILGYSYESWHYRYVGVEIATYMHENNLIYEEYYVQFLDK